MPNLTRAAIGLTHFTLGSLYLISSQPGKLDHLHSQAQIISARAEAARANAQNEVKKTWKMFCLENTAHCQFSWKLSSPQLDEHLSRHVLSRVTMQKSYQYAVLLGPV